MSSSNSGSRVEELFHDAMTGKLSRRELLRRAGALGLSGTALSLLFAACGGGAATPAATETGTATATATPTSAATATATAAATETATAAATATAAGTVSGRGNDVFIAAVYGDIDMWDPALLNGSKPAQTAVQNTMDQLTKYATVEKTLDDGTTFSIFDAENILPMLAESWEMKDADMIFHLTRQGVKFNPSGNPVDANTVLEAYKRFFEVQGVATFLLGMGGSVTDPSQLEAPDPETFIIHMTKANGLTAKNIVMGNTSITDAEEVQANATDADPWAAEYYRKNYPSGTGPYKLGSYTPGDNITLVPNETYWGTPPKFAKVIEKIVPDASQRVLLLKSGDVDIIDNVPLKELAGLKQDPNIRVLPVPTTYTYLGSMNVNIPPFDVKEVRQAVSYAIPYDAIIKEALFGYGKRLWGPVPEGQRSYDPSIKMYETNPDKAKELLAQAGFKDGSGLPQIKLSIKIGFEEAERVAVIIQAALRNIGMNVQIEKLPLAAYNEAHFGRKQQFSLIEWDMWVNDPYYNQFWYFTTEGSNNSSAYSNPQVDELINNYALYPSGDERDNASKEAQRIILEEAPYLFLYQMIWPVAMRADIEGYAFYNDTLLRYDAMSRKV